MSFPFICRPISFSLSFLIGVLVHRSNNQRHLPHIYILAKFHLLLHQIPSSILDFKILHIPSSNFKFSPHSLLFFSIFKVKVHSFIIIAKCSLKLLYNLCQILWSNKKLLIKIIPGLSFSLKNRKRKLIYLVILSHLNLLQSQHNLQNPSHITLFISLRSRYYFNFISFDHYTGSFLSRPW